MKQRAAMTLPLAMQGKEPAPRLVFPLGEPKPNDDRKWRFTETDFQRVAANFASRTEALPLFAAHGDDPSWGKKAMGWADSCGVGPDGFYLNVRWTDKAREEIRAGHWGYVSPGFEGEEDEEGFIHPVALNELSPVNDPAIGGMVPLTASTNTAPRKADGKEKDMAENTTVTAAKTKAGAFDGASILQLVRDGFKIPDVIDDATLGGLIAQALSGEKGKELGDSPPPMGGAGAVPPALAALAERMKKQEEETAALKTSKDVEAEIEKGVKERRLSPALVETAKLIAKHGGLEPLRGFVASLQPTQPDTGSVVTGGTTQNIEASEPDDHVGRHLAAYSAQNAPTHRNAIAYLAKARAAGKKATYREAIIATTRKTA